MEMLAFVGAHLLNAIRGTSLELFYWREAALEVDFVLRQGASLIGIEVKTRGGGPKSAIDVFAKCFRPKKMLLVGKEGMSLEKFLNTPPVEFFL